MNAWPTHPISELGRVTTGSTPSTSEEDLYGGDTPFVTPAELDQTAPVLTATRTLSPLGIAKARLLPPDTVMVCCIGSLGKVGISGRTVATNQQINSVEFDQTRVWPRYGFYACRLLRRRLEMMAPATTVAIVSKSKFEKLSIPVPPLPEQRRIAAILDKADALRAKRRAALAQLDTLAQSIFLDMFGDPATNPKGWPHAEIRQLGRVSTGGTPPSAKPGMFDGPIPFITPGDLESEEPVKRALTEAGAKESVTVRAGSTLVCCIGATIGKIGKADARSALNQQINAVEWGGTVDDTYGYWGLRFFKPTIVAWGTSTTLPILRKSSFERIEVPVPPLDLQRDFSQRIAKVEQIRSSSRTSLVSLDELFGSLQSRAFRGEL